MYKCSYGQIYRCTCTNVHKKHTYSESFDRGPSNGTLGTTVLALVASLNLDESTETFSTGLGTSLSTFGGELKPLWISLGADDLPSL